MCVSNSLYLLSETFLVPRRKGFYHKITLVFMLSTRHSCQILMKLEFPRQIFEKYSKFVLRETNSVGSRVVLCGRTDRQTDRQTKRQTDMTKLMVAFQNFANAPKIPFIIIILSKFTLSKRSIFFKFPHQNHAPFSHFTHPYHIPRPSPSPWFCHTREYRLWTSLLCIISNFVLIAPN
jgi:hypothetical protein